MFSYFPQSYPKWKNRLDKVLIYEDPFKWNMLDGLILILELIIVNIPVTSVEWIYHLFTFVLHLSPVLPD